MQRRRHDNHKKNTTLVKLIDNSEEVTDEMPIITKEDWIEFKNALEEATRINPPRTLIVRRGTVYNS